MQTDTEIERALVDSSLADAFQSCIYLPLMDWLPDWFVDDHFINSFNKVGALGYQIGIWLLQIYNLILCTVGSFVPVL